MEADLVVEDLVAVDLEVAVGAHISLISSRNATMVEVVQVQLSFEQPQFVCHSRRLEILH